MVHRPQTEVGSTLLQTTRHYEHVYTQSVPIEGMK